MRTITFYSYKGGTGRTLAVANTAQFLARFGHRVFVLDFDLEAPGLHYKLGIRPSRQGSPLTGLVDWIHSYKTTGLVPKIEPYVQEVKCLPRGSKGHIWLMPAGDAPSPQYSQQLATIELAALFNVDVNAGQTFPVALPLFLELKGLIENSKYQPDYLLIDSRTGLTEIGGVAVRLMPDVVVCLVHNNPENKAGARKVLRNVKTAYRSTKPPIEMVVTLVRIPEMPLDRETALLKEVQDGFNEQAEISEETLDINEVLPLHSDPDLQVVENLRVGGGTTANESILLRDYFKLFRKLELDKNLKPEEKAVLEELAEADRSEAFRPLLLDARRLTAQSALVPVSMRVRLSERSSRKLKVVIPAYLTGRNYGSFINRVRERLVENMSLAPEMDVLPDAAVRWDLLAVHLREGVLDFCADVYYLTENRGHLVEIVQLGWCSTFTGYVRTYSPLHELLAGKGERTLVETLRFLLKRFPDLAVGVLGDTAAASEANQHLSPLLSATKLISKGSERDLMDWLQAEQDVFVICDRVVAARLTRLSGGEEYSAVPSFRFEQKIPAGIMYPREDREWRKELSRAIADSLIEFLTRTGSAGWLKVEKEFEENGLDALSLTQLHTSLLLDMPFERAIEWDRKFRLPADTEAASPI